MEADVVVDATGSHNLTDALATVTMEMEKSPSSREDSTGEDSSRECKDRRGLATLQFGKETVFLGAIRRYRLGVTRMNSQLLSWGAPRQPITRRRPPCKPAPPSFRR